MNFSEKEQEVLSKWERDQIFKKTLEKNSPKGPFVFFEGPPTANGRPGIHHAEARAFKDCIPRFRTMQGYRVVRKGGWDTHGLPVEIEVEKQLGFTGKAQIEEYGIAKFNELCKQNVWKYKKEWEEFTKRLGFWVDLENAYVTYAPEYVETLWWIIKQVWNKGLLYKDYRVTPHCPRCGTSLSSHELAQGYKDVKDLSVTAKFLIVEEKAQRAQKAQMAEREYILAWTTTPWTLPGNVALAVGKDIDYVKVKQGDEFLWLAKNRLSIMKGEYEVVEEVKGEKLIGKKYEPLYPFLRNVILSETKDHVSNDKAWSIVPADFVTTEDGTGVVHTAVMYGVDDFELGNKIGLPKHHLVKLDGTFIEGMDFLSGRLVTDEDVAVDIIKDLAHRGLLFSKEKFEHSYPHCWRCKTKLIYYAKDSWYIAMTKLRDELLKQNDNIHWEPEHIKDGRFGEWLREVKDWAFSRERYWGTPLPIWECVSCKHQMCVGSFEELFASTKPPHTPPSKGGGFASFPPSKGGIKGGLPSRETFEPHRPYIDEIELKCEKCSEVAKRVPDVCDVWFDSGAMPFAQWHYPFENKELVDSGEGFPADYISEAIDQTRGWFYTLLAVSTLLGKERPFKNVICLGHVLDAEGKKMSKSLGNIVLPMDVIEKYGADAIRWYMYTINQPGESKRFDEKALSEMVKKNFGILSNVVSFYQMFAEKSEKTEKAQRTQRENILDKWILARLHKLTKETTSRLEDYIITETVREFGNFIDDLSTWYVRRSRDRFKTAGLPHSQGGTKGGLPSDKQSAIATLHECLLTLSKLIAPFAPFLAETIYEDIGGEKESVHLEDWPTYDSSLIDDSLLLDMQYARGIVSRVLERRSEAGIPVRQALGSMKVSLPSGELTRDYQDLILDEVNVKKITVQKGDLSVELDLTLTPELLRDGIAREIIRHVNALRKEKGLTINDRIELFVSGSDEVMRALEEHNDTILHGTLSSSVRKDGEVPEINESFQVNENEIVIGFVLK